MMLSVSCWADSLWRAIWQGGLALLLAWLVCRLLSRLTPRVQCWLGRLAYLKLFVALVWVTPLNLPLLPPSPSLENLAALPELSTPTTLPMPPSTPAAIHLGMGTSVVIILFLLWLAGIGWRVRQMARDWQAIQTMRQRCRRCNAPDLEAECQELCRRMAVRRCPPILLMAGAEGPLLCGLLRPAILLPEALWQESTPSQRRLILAHELAHLKRQDLFWAWLPGLARCLFFFHPLVWLAEREWQQSQEMACDEQALRLAGASRSDYGNLLLTIALQPRPAFPSGLMALRVAESYMTVQRRLQAMKHAGKMSHRNLVVAGALLGALGVAGIVPWRVIAQEASKSEREKSAVLHEVHGFSKQTARELGLTETQIKRLSEIHAISQRELQQVLTPDQQKRLGAKSNPMVEILERLGLTEEQAAHIKTLHEEILKRVQAIKEDPTLSREEKEAQVKSLIEEAHQQTLQALTPEQQKKFAALHKQAQEPKGDPNLTEEQKQKLDAIKMHVEQHIQAIEQDATLSQEQKAARKKEIMEVVDAHLSQILTPEQQKIRAEQLRKGQVTAAGDPYSIANLKRLGDLNEAQMTRIRAIYQKAEKQTGQILTPEQKQKLQKLHAEVGGEHHK